MTAIQPTVLMWARETAGLSLEDAAGALGFSETLSRTGAQRLHDMERGLEEPARGVLLKMAKTYRRPLLVFYLAEPPRIGDRGKDFRTLPENERFNPELDALVRDIKARQGIIRSMLEDEEAGPLEFVGSASMEVRAPRLAARIAEQINFSLAEYRAAKTTDAAFAYLRESIENSGIFVLLLGNLGSHHTNIPAEVFRGFALADRIAPLIVINDQDAKAAWPFTACHELAHLWLGATGISAADGENRVERYCNEVAGEFLLPANEVRSLIPSKNEDLATAADRIGEFAQARHVSRAMVAYRLYRTGAIGKATWEGLSQRFKGDCAQFKQREADRNRIAEGGPNYYVVRRHRMGRALLQLVRRSLDEGTITYTKASTVLGVKARNVEPLLSMRGAR